MKSDFTLGGFRFKVTDQDYDYLKAKSVPYKANKNNVQRAFKFKYETEHDFCYDERDCTGSTCEEVNIRFKKGGYITVYYYWSKDV